MRNLQCAAVSAAIGLAAATITGCAAGPTKVVVITASPAAAVVPASARATAAAAAPATPARHQASRSRPAPAATTAPLATYVDPVTVVQKFYSDLNRRDYEAAYAIGGYNTFGGNDYQSWVAGYADTTGVIGHASDAGNGVVDTSFEAYHSDGSVQTYSGTYTVRHDVIVAADMHLVSTR